MFHAKPNNKERKFSPMSNFLFFRLLSVLCICLALLFVGCGEDEIDDTDSTDSGDVITAEEPSGPNILEGKITVDLTLKASREHVLRGAVFVENGATLTIEPGTTIYGEGVSNGTLIIAQGSKIMAEGTPNAPIVFTSDALEGSRGRGQWGGLIINGRAPSNQGVTFGEGDTGAFGGNNPSDSSGVLKYVRVEFAGIEFSPDNELNGIAFQGVGSGTVVDYVQVHFNQDDGIEMFGGTVNIKHALVTGARDDSFDWTDGWTGKGQFWIAQQRGDEADNGFENDNSSKNNDATPRSAPTIYNATLIGDPQGPTSDTGMLIREGAAGIYRNIIVHGFKNKAGLDIDNASTIAQANGGSLTIQNTIFSNNQPGNFAEPDEDFDEAAWAMDPAFNNLEADAKLRNPFAQSDPDFRPAADSPAVNGTIPVAPPPGDGFFEPVNFVGGMGPNDNWTQGWTTTAQN